MTAQLLGPEFQVNSYTPSGQSRPAVAVDASGNFVVVWSDYSQESLLDLGIFGQGFDPAAGPLGTEFHVNSFTTSHQQYPAVAASGTNNFLVVWDSNGQDGSARGIFGRRFSAAGLPAGSEFMVNTYTTGYQLVPAVATDSNGFFVVVWNGAGLTDSAGVFGQRFNPAGSTVGSEFRVNSYTPSSQQEAAVAADGLGNFVVVWASASQDGSNFGVFGQRFDSVGTAVRGRVPGQYLHDESAARARGGCRRRRQLRRLLDQLRPGRRVELGRVRAAIPFLRRQGGQRVPGQQLHDQLASSSPWWPRTAPATSS